MAVITISRQDGAGGEGLAHRIGQVLGYRVVDKEVLVRVAAMAHVPVEQVAEFAEGRGSAIERFLHAVVRGLPGMGEYYAASAEAMTGQADVLRHYVYYGHREGKADFSRLRREDCLRYFAAAVRDLAERGNVVVVGRGGQVLLADFPHTLHVRAIAAEGSRAAAVAAELGLEDEAALEHVRRADEHRADYLRDNYDHDINDPGLYDLVVRLDRVDAERVVAFVRDWAVGETVRHESQLRAGGRPKR